MIDSLVYIIVLCDIYYFYHYHKKILFVNASNNVHCLTIIYRRLHLFCKKNQ